MCKIGGTPLLLTVVQRGVTVEGWALAEEEGIGHQLRGRLGEREVRTTVRESIDTDAVHEFVRLSAQMQNDEWHDR